jgi:prevent-host-death family protein
VADIPVRELRNNVSQVLRRVEAGERLRVTVSGRPVAALVPLGNRPQEMPWNQFLSSLTAVRADAALTDELRVLLPDRTDELPL